MWEVGCSLMDSEGRGFVRCYYVVEERKQDMQFCRRCGVIGSLGVVSSSGS